MLVAGLFLVALRGALARARHSPVELGLFGALAGFAFHELVDFNGQIPANAATFVALAALAARPREAGRATALIARHVTPRMSVQVEFRLPSGRGR